MTGIPPPSIWLLAAFVAAPAAAQTGAFPDFVDVSAELGVTLVNVSGEGNADYIIEVNGNGAGFFDYDDDGDVDLLVTNGSTLERYREGGDPLATLYENADGVFRDVTAASGLNDTGWGFGVCVADYDNDGRSDVYLTAWGPNKLYRNLGNGRFEETGEGAGVADGGWGTNCAFGDYDRDGDVDLYVANYLTFDDEVIPRRGDPGNELYLGELEVMIGPLSLPGESDVLYRNDGNGAFTDVTAASGIDDPGHFGFGVQFSDFDNDGWTDIYVANDSTENLMFRNDRDGTFSEIGLISGTSVSLMGYAQAGMGLAVADYDGNGYFDIFVTNFSQDTNTLYRNLGDMLFTDATAASATGAPSRLHLGWGAGFADLDNDGWVDLFVANGHVYPNIGELDLGVRHLQPKEIYRNLGDGRFEAIAAEQAGDPAIPKPARGAAFADYDNDGDVDVIAINMNEGPSFYRNEGGNRNRWIGFRLVGVSSNRDAIGARVEIDAGGRTQSAEVRSGGSYLSHNDMRVHFGLGDADAVDRVRVRWPDGESEELQGVAGGRYWLVREGEGRVIPGP